jgi:hypothetical protein
MAEIKTYSLRGFAKLAGMSPQAVHYHLKKGTIQSSPHIVTGIAETELQKLRDASHTMRLREWEREKPKVDKA